MPIEVCSISGFSKTEGNSVAIKIDEEVVILDMGLSMSDYVRYTEDREDITPKTYKELLKVNAVPDYNHIEDWKEKVIAIIPSHGHLDHIGAVPFAAPLFRKAPIISTPYTIEVIKSIIYDERMELPNRLIPVNSNSSYKLSDNITIEFVHITHSIPHTAAVVLHTPYGKVMYVNDFKLDDHPVLGKKPNYERLKELGQEGIQLLIVNCLYAHEHRKCPSESVAKEMLKDVMLGVQSEGRGMIVTTFSSHLARLRSIIDLGKKLNRKIIFIGRSLEKYINAAQRIQLVDFSQEMTLVRYKDKVIKELQKVQREGKGKYLIVCTGHQGEPKSVLSRLARGDLPFHFESGDIVIFSCNVIPVEVNQKNRQALEQVLSSKNVRMFRDVHVSGHGALEDHRDLLEMIRPKHIMPIHAENAKARMLGELAEQLGFKNTHIMQDGKRVKI